MSFAIVLIPLTHKPIHLERRHNATKENYLKKKGHKSTLPRHISSFFFIKKVIKILSFSLMLFYFGLIFGISSSPIGISLIRLSELLDCTEVNPSKYVEPNSFKHKPCSWVPYKHLQLFATKSLFLLLLLLLRIFLAFSSSRREVLWIGHWVWYSLRRIKLGPWLRNDLTCWCTILFEIWQFCGWTSS